MFKHSSKDVKLFLVLLTAKFAQFISELLDFFAAPEPAFHSLPSSENEKFLKFLSSLFEDLLIDFFENYTSRLTSSLFRL